MIGRYPVLTELDEAFKMLTTAHLVYMACECHVCKNTQNNRERECKAFQVQDYLEKHHERLKCEADGKRLEAIRADKAPEPPTQVAISIATKRALAALAAMGIRAEKTPFNPVPRLPIQCPEEFREELRGLVPMIMRLMGCGFESSHLNDAVISLKNEHKRSGASEAHADWEAALKACENDS